MLRRQTLTHSPAPLWNPLRCPSLPALSSNHTLTLGNINNVITVLHYTSHTLIGRPAIACRLAPEAMFRDRLAVPDVLRRLFALLRFLLLLLGRHGIGVGFRLCVKRFSVKVGAALKFEEGLYLPSARPAWSAVSAGCLWIRI